MCSHDQTRSQVWGEEPGGEEPSPRRQGCCRPCDLVLRLTLTPQPRSCWPRILHVRLLSAPNSVLFAGKLPSTAPSWRQGGGHPSWRAEDPRESLGSLLPGAGLFSPLVDYSVMLYMAVDPWTFVLYFPIQHHALRSAAQLSTLSPRERPHLAPWIFSR